MAVTEGEWRAIHGSPNAYVVAGDYADEGDPDLLAEVSSEDPDADARLMAAAPDMYDALKAQEKAEEHFDNCDHCCAAEPCTDYLVLAGEAQWLRVAAIAKAEGQTPEANG